MPALHLPNGSRQSYLPALELSSETPEANSPVDSSDGENRDTELVLLGELDVLGRMAWSSNATLLVNASLEGIETRAIYKPIQGERGLWDFPDGTLAGREVSAFEVSEALGWGVVPYTVMRDGPYGMGMVQRFVEHDPDDHFFTLRARYADEFRRFAVLDVLANNTDRKGGHCLEEKGTGRVFGIDHGLTFHQEWKLRTVIWDFAGEEIPPDLLSDVERVVDDLAKNGELFEKIRDLISPLEIAAMRERADEILEEGTFPIPDEDYHSVPWPLI